MIKVTLKKNVNFGSGVGLKLAGTVFEFNNPKEIPETVLASIEQAMKDKSTKTYKIEEIEEKGTPIAPIDTPVEEAEVKEDKVEEKEAKTEVKPVKKEKVEAKPVKKVAKPVKKVTKPVKTVKKLTKKLPKIKK